MDETGDWDLQSGCPDLRVSELWMGKYTCSYDAVLNELRVHNRGNVAVLNDNLQRKEGGCSG